MLNQYFYIPSMTSTQLLQVKIDPILKQDLDDIAEYKGIPVTSLVKLVLKETVREAKKQIYTQNGLTVDQELEILQRDEETQKAHRKGKLSPKSFSTLIRELNA